MGISQVKRYCTPLKCVGDRPDAVAAAMLSYATQIAQEVMAGRRDLHGSPWVLPSDVGRGAVAAPAVDAILRPRVFIWVPERLAPGWQLPCPTCTRRTS